FLGVVLVLGKKRQKLGEIHLAPVLRIRGVPEVLREGLISSFTLFDFFGGFPFPRERDVIQFVAQTFLKKRRILVEQIAPSPLFTGQAKGKPRIHPFRGLFHLLPREHALEVFPQNDVDRTSESIEQQDSVQTDPDQKDQDRAEPKKNSPLHDAAPPKFRRIQQV